MAQGQGSHPRVVYPAKDPDLEDFPARVYENRYDAAFQDWIICPQLVLSSRPLAGITEGPFPRLNCHRAGNFELDHFSAYVAHKFLNKVAAVYVYAANWPTSSVDLCAAAYEIWGTKYATLCKSIPRGTRYSICQGIDIIGDTLPSPATVISHHKTLTLRVEFHEEAIDSLRVMGLRHVVPSWKHVLILVDGAVWRDYKMTNLGREGTQNVPVVVVGRLDTMERVETSIQGWSDCTPTTNDGVIFGKWLKKDTNLTSAIHLVMKVDELFESTAPGADG